jgi:hypothetical protein
MKNIKKRNIEDDFAPVGTKECQMKCDRIVLKTKSGPVLVCNECKRIVMDMRDKTSTI